MVLPVTSLIAKVLPFVPVVVMVYCTTVTSAARSDAPVVYDAVGNRVKLTDMAPRVQGSITDSGLCGCGILYNVIQVVDCVL